jgi:eukaryotic-like serine/threonine-protein kinase
MKEKSLFKYLLSKEFWKQIRLALAIFFTIIFLTTIFLKIYTRHNSSRPVPDFKGLTDIESKELADDNNLRVQIIDSVFNQDQKPGTVVEQEPKAGSLVKKYRRIFLVMNAVNPEKIAMPNIVGVSLRQAVAILELNGLYIGHFKYVPDIATNNVLKQIYKKREIRSGAQINKGSNIDLVLGKAGDISLTKIPELKGQSLKAARKTLALASLNVGTIRFDHTIFKSADSLKAVVVKQEPEFSESATLNSGSSVKLWLSMPKEKADIKTDEKNE